jgi:hypothetical protein
MRIFEPHIHMYARTTQDYEEMAKAGVECIVEPAFWLGETRKYAGTFFDYYDHLLNYEHSRAAKYGIKQYVAISMNPKEANNYELAEEVIEELPRFLENPKVVAVGEIGLDAINPTEEEFFLRQAELARQYKLPLLIHTPHIHKVRGVQRLVELLKGLDYDMDMVDMDHNVEETTEISKAAGCWLGYTLYSYTKVTPERMVNMLEEHGFDKMMANSSADWGPSDCLMLVHLAEELRDRGHKEKEVQKILWDNPFAFYSKSGRIR